MTKKCQNIVDNWNKTVFFRTRGLFWTIKFPVSMPNLGRGGSCCSSRVSGQMEKTCGWMPERWQ